MQWLPWQLRPTRLSARKRASRPALVVSPQLDYQSTRKDIDLCVTEAGRVFSLLGAKEKLQILDIDDYNHFSPELQKQVFEQFRRLAGF